MATPQRKRLPPGGRAILEARRNGLIPRDRLLLICTFWHKGKRSVCIPADLDLDPESLDFSFAAGIDAVVAHRGEPARARKIAQAVFQANPRRLQVWNLDPPFGTEFIVTAGGPDHG